MIPDGQQRFAAGLDHYRAGRLAEAEAELRRAISADPRHTDALHLLAVVNLDRGGAAGAVALVRRAVQLRPTFPVAWNTLGECYRRIHQLPPAIDCFRTAIGQDPALAAAQVNLALALSDAGQVGPAEAACRSALALDPTLTQAHALLGSLVIARGDPAAAAAALRRAIADGRPTASVYNNLGVALEATDQLPEAADAYRRAAELDPASATIANNYLNVARQLNRWDEAMAWTDRILTADPTFGPARWNRGLLDLTRGDYAAGLPNYEVRFTGTAQRHPPFLAGRPWDGRADLSGGTLLLYAEQGFGDGFQAARYVPVVAGRVGRVVLLCHPSQARLFARLPGAWAVSSELSGLPAYDRFAAMMSLPFLCRTTAPADVPAAVPYLTPPPDCVDRWRTRLAPAGARPTVGPRVGLVWAGAARPDPLRTIPLADLSPLLAVTGVRWVSLQVGPASSELATVPAAADVDDLSPHLTDFAETAAALGQLDLLITIDTGTAHLAGAVGCPTWTLLPFSPDWRWMLDRSDSPWYPTMRLFRQAERKEWGPVVAEVTAALQAWAAARPG